MCLNALKFQGMQDFELIIVNDGSSPEATRFVQSSIEDFPRKAYFEIANSGQGAARNLGIDKAQGRYVCFCDQDDQYDHSFLGHSYFLAELHSLDILVHNYSINDGQETVPIELGAKATLYKDLILGLSDIQVWNKFIRTDFLRSCTRFYNLRTTCEDLMVFPQWLLAARRIGFNPTFMYTHQVRSDQQSKSLTTEQRSLDILKAVRLLSSLPVSGQARSYLEAVVQLHLELPVIREYGIPDPFSPALTRRPSTSFAKGNAYYRFQTDKVALKAALLETRVRNAGDVKISLITVCLNAEATLGRTIDSVVSQQFDDLEYLILDGGSTDRTSAIVSSYPQPWIRYVTQKDDGIYDAMNKGIALTRGKVIGILNADDWLTPQALKKVWRVFDESADTDVVYGGVHAVDEDGNFQFDAYGTHDNLMTYMLPHPAIFVRKAVYDFYGTFDSRYKIVADYDLVSRLYIGNCRFICVDEFLANYRTNGFSSRNPRLTLEEVDLVRKANFGYQKIFASQRDLYWKSHAHGAGRTSSGSAALGPETGSMRETLASRIKRRLKGNRFSYGLWISTGKIVREYRRSGLRITVKKVLRECRRRITGSSARMLQHQIATQKLDVSSNPFVRQIELFNAPIPTGRASAALPADADILWFIPDFSRGAGGHTTIFRFINLLAQRGITSDVAVVQCDAPATVLKERINEYFFPFHGEVLPLQHPAELERVTRTYRASMATAWETAYFSIRFERAQKRGYFVQDFEPNFFNQGTYRIMAENTYRMPFDFCFTVGTWIKERLVHYGRDNIHAFSLAYDPKVYFRDPKIQRNGNRVFYYARPTTERRGFEIGIGALYYLSQLLPGIEIHTFGYDLSGHDRHLITPTTEQSVRRNAPPCTTCAMLGWSSPSLTYPWCRWRWRLAAARWS